MKKILISGGTSYLGQMLINSFGAKFDVTALTRNENNFSIVDKNLNFKIIKTDKQSIKKLRSKEFDVYINLIE